MSYGDFENLTRRTATDKELRDKTSNIAKMAKGGWISIYTCSNALKNIW